MKAVCIAAILLIVVGCASKPYVINTIINEAAKTKTETICTHKTYVIPWYIGVAGGFVKFDGAKECHDETMAIKHE